MPSAYLLVSVLAAGAVLVALVPVIDEDVLGWIVGWDQAPRLDPLLAAAILFGPVERRARVRVADCRRLAASTLERLAGPPVGCSRSRLREASSAPS